MSLPYYPMYPRDFYEGTQEMSLELKGAYIMVLNLMYTRGGPISDEPGFISRYVGCSIRKWKQVRDELVAMGKLVCESGMISNSRAHFEIEKQRSYQDKQAENRARPNKNNDQQTPPKTTHAKPEPEPEEEQGRVERERAPAFDFSEVDGNDLDQLEAACRKWANGSFVPFAGPVVLAPIVKLLKPQDGKNAVTMDDVRNGILRGASTLHQRGDRTNSLEYFVKPILRERDARLKPNPEVSHDNAAFVGGESGVAIAGRDAAGRTQNASRRGAAFAQGQYGRGSIADAAIRRHLQRQNGVGVSGGDERGSDVAAEADIVDGNYRRIG